MQVDRFQEENDALMRSFLEHTFFRGWKEDIPNLNRVEFTFDPRCNLACKYCYYVKHQNGLYPYIDYKAEEKHAKMVIDWLIANDYHPNVDIFAGEPTIKPYFYRVLDYYIDKYKNTEWRPEVIIPTNYSFLLSSTLTDKVKNLIEKARAEGFRIYLSASVDGKYCDDNRPFKNLRGSLWDDKLYEKMFRFNKEYGYGFHPMVYSNKIEKWKDNFLWFQDNFKKYGIPYSSIYLLEVRNPEWHPKQLKELEKFLDFLVKWTFNYLGGNKHAFVDFLFNLRGYNILNPFSTIGRGIGCSLQSMLYIRMSDLKIIPCHRTSYNPFVYGEFVTDSNKITGIKSSNPELMVAVYTLDAKNFPYCEQCPIRHICSHGCLGAQYEFTGDLFTPFPTLCQLELVKNRAIVKSLKDIGVLGMVKGIVAPEVRSDIENLEAII